MEDVPVMKTFNLRSEWTDLQTERSIIASIANDPNLYWELTDTLSADVFAFDETREVWQTLEDMAEADSAIATPIDWTPTKEPQEAAQTLLDLAKRRLLADLIESMGSNLKGTRPASELLTEASAAIASAQAAVQKTDEGKLTWAADLLGPILKDAEERHRQREKTGKPVMGLLTGIAGLDVALNGLSQGLYILAGPPGMGKTTLALQIAADVAKRGTPTVYVTYENSPENLILKAIAGRAGVNSQDVTRGWADMKALWKAADDWLPVAERLAVVEGSSKLTVAQVKALALRAMNRHKAKQCFVVVDYLQLMGKACVDLRGLSSVRERVEVLGGSLRELSTRLGSPVLALASQNRAQGGYNTGEGKVALDSLKESGDLEYMADVVLFLTKDAKRIIAEPARAIDLTIAKNRNGATGTVQLVFRPGEATFREVAHGR
jgi:replicative DNA helicase